MHFFWSASLLTATVAATPIVVNTVNDVTYEGTTADGVEQFQNIHFAEDTSGANRFEPPVPYFPTPGTKVDASKPGAGCPQATRGAIPAMIDVPYQSEDCLTLRIARPEKFEGPLPVMVYIYGGMVATEPTVLERFANRFIQVEGYLEKHTMTSSPLGALSSSRLQMRIQSFMLQ